MRYKVKAIIGFYQCIAAVPSVFDVVTPPGLEEYTRWIRLVELPAILGLELVLPGKCLGSYLRFAARLNKIGPLVSKTLRLTIAVCVRE
eukprot:5838347-Prymnesium_polylepis.1